MPELQPLVNRLASLLIGVITGVAVSLVMLFNIITKGPTRFFYRKEYEKRPKCMMDPVYGQHGYVTLKVIFVHLTGKMVQNNVIYNHKSYNRINSIEFWYH